MAGRSRKTMGEIRIRITIKRVGARLRSELRRGSGGGLGVLEPSGRQEPDGHWSFLMSQPSTPCKH